MKKLHILIISLIILVATNNIYAQKKERSTLQLGAKISPNISWLNPDATNFSSNGTKIKFSWGFIADFKFAEKYSFSTGFSINSTGGKIIHPDSTTTLGNGSLSRDITIRYVEFPLSVKMKTRQFGYFTFFGQVGLGLGMRLAARSDDTFSSAIGSAPTIKNDVKIEDQVEFFRLSMILAAGVEYSLGGSTSLFGALSFNNGFTNVFNYNTPFTKADANSNTVDLSVGILF